MFTYIRLNRYIHQDNTINNSLSDGNQIGIMSLDKMIIHPKRGCIYACFKHKTPREYMSADDIIMLN